MPAVMFMTLALYLSGINSGQTIKLGRFMSVVAITVTTFAGVYFVDDAVPGCGRTTWTLASFWRYVYYSVTNLTSLGANPGHCGPYRGIIISVESLFGFFLLSVLAAMLYTWLNAR
jgi:hypothetical protein